MFCPNLAGMQDSDIHLLNNCITVMKKYIATSLLVLSTGFIGSPLSRADGWEWNPMKLLTPPKWVTKPVTSTSAAISKTTKSTWKSVSRGTATAWKKTAEFLDPYPDPKPEDAFERPQTMGEFIGQDRPE